MVISVASIRRQLAYVQTLRGYGICEDTVDSTGSNITLL